MAEKEIDIRTERHSTFIQKPWLTISLLAISVLALGGILFAGVQIVAKSARKTTVVPTLISENNLKQTSPPSETEWKTYKSPELGFSIKYPTDWHYPEVLQLPGGILIDLNNVLSISTGSNFPTGLSFQDYMIGDYKGKIAMIQKPDGTKEITIVFPHPYSQGKFLIITYIEEPQTVDVVNEILSTLDFVDTPTPTMPAQTTEDFSVAPTPASFLLPTPTHFFFPTPGPTSIGETEEKCIYGCVSEDKFK